VEDLWSDLERYGPTVEEHRHAVLELAHLTAVIGEKVRAWDAERRSFLKDHVFARDEDSRLKKTEATPLALGNVCSLKREAKPKQSALPPTSKPEPSRTSIKGNTSRAAIYPFEDVHSHFRSLEKIDKSTSFSFEEKRAARLELARARQALYTDPEHHELNEDALESLRRLSRKVGPSNARPETSESKRSKSTESLPSPLAAATNQVAAKPTVEAPLARQAEDKPENKGKQPVYGSQVTYTPGHADTAALGALFSRHPDLIKPHEVSVLVNLSSELSEVYRSLVQEMWETLWHHESIPSLYKYAEKCLMDIGIKIKSPDASHRGLQAKYKGKDKGEDSGEQKVAESAAEHGIEKPGKGKGIEVVREDEPGQHDESTKVASSARLLTQQPSLHIGKIHNRVAQIPPEGPEATESTHQVQDPLIIEPTPTPMDTQPSPKTPSSTYSQPSTTEAQASDAPKSVQSSGFTDGIWNVRKWPALASNHSTSSSSMNSMCFEECFKDPREEATQYKARIEEVDDEDVGGKYLYR